uniref:NHR domain-containing protein n=1 Tax=Amphimedon queenslandica TaxID=400682 RepID=A0A1X7V9M8_AMPQE
MAGGLPHGRSKERLRFMLPAEIQFGYNKYYCGNKVWVSNEAGTEAVRQPDRSTNNGVVYSEKPVKGRVEFEVEITSHSLEYSGNIRLGIMSHKPSEPFDLSKIPFSCTWKAPYHCIWAGSLLYNNIARSIAPRSEGRSYGKKSLEDLRKGDRVGILLMENGELHFLINGEPQGKAASGIYERAYDVYIVVDHFADCKGLHTRGNMLLATFVVTLIL